MSGFIQPNGININSIKSDPDIADMLDNKHTQGSDEAFNSVLNGIVFAEDGYLTSSDIRKYISVTDGYDENPPLIMASYTLNNQTVGVLEFQYDTNTFFTDNDGYFSVIDDPGFDVSHLDLNDLNSDDHEIYVLADGYREFTGQISSTLPTRMYPNGTTQTVDWAQGNYQVLDLRQASGDVTLTFVDAPTGTSAYLLKVVQHATVIKNVIWPSNVRWPGDVIPIISDVGSKVDLISLFWDPSVSTYYGSFGQGFTI